MNILFVHEADLLNKVVFEIHNLAEILSKNHNVFAIDYEESWKRKNIFDPGTLRTREFKHISRAYNGRGFTLRRPGMIKLPLLSRLSAFFTHYFEIEKIIKKEKIDAITAYVSAQSSCPRRKAAGRIRSEKGRLVRRLWKY